jgi:hypothetical protein
MTSICGREKTPAHTSSGKFAREHRDPAELHFKGTWRQEILRCLLSRILHT